MCHVFKQSGLGKGPIFPFLLLLIVTALTACGTGYYTLDDERIAHLGETDDVRLALTQAFGAPLAPIVRNIQTLNGRLFYRDGLEAELRSKLKPLDIVITRSRPAMTRLMIPSHFTHAMIWLGTEAEMKRLGVWDLPEIREHHDELKKGRTIIESAKDSVHLSPITEMMNVDELVILRDGRRNPSRLRKKYAALFRRLGVTFDYNFDYRDASRLTCAELVAEVNPEYGIPVRYTTGRRSIIPDDLVWIGLDSGGPLRFHSWIHGNGTRPFTVAGASKVRAVLTRPKPKPDAD